MRALYASEINCGIESFWDGGWRVWIGDYMNGIAAEDHGNETFEEAAKSLDRLAREVRPHSDYAKSPPR